MPFHAEPIARPRLNMLDAVADWISDTHCSLNRILTEDVLECGATFECDAHPGRGDALLHQNTKKL